MSDAVEPPITEELGPGSTLLAQNANKIALLCLALCHAAENLVHEAELIMVHSKMILLDTVSRIV